MWQHRTLLRRTPRNRKPVMRRRQAYTTVGCSASTTSPDSLCSSTYVCAQPIDPVSFRTIQYTCVCVRERSRHSHMHTRARSRTDGTYRYTGKRMHALLQLHVENDWCGVEDKILSPPPTGMQFNGLCRGRPGAECRKLHEQKFVRPVLLLLLMRFCGRARKIYFALLGSQNKPRYRWIETVVTRCTYRPQAILTDTWWLVDASGAGYRFGHWLKTKSNSCFFMYVPYDNTLRLCALPVVPIVLAVLLLLFSLCLGIASGRTIVIHYVHLILVVAPDNRICVHTRLLYVYNIYKKKGTTILLYI